MKRALSLLAEHKTAKDDEQFLGKGQFAIPDTSTRTRTKLIYDKVRTTHSVHSKDTKDPSDYRCSVPRIGSQYQATIPDFKEVSKNSKDLFTDNSVLMNAKFLSS